MKAGAWGHVYPVCYFILPFMKYCVCNGCRNSTLTGHEVHFFLNRNKNGVSFHAQVCFVKVKRWDFVSALVIWSAAVCDAHLQQEDSVSDDDVMKFGMGYWSQVWVRLRRECCPINTDSCRFTGSRSSLDGFFQRFSSTERELSAVAKSYFCSDSWSVNRCSCLSLCRFLL